MSEGTAVLGVHYRSVQRWIAWYRQGGLAPVRRRQKGGVGQMPFLSTQSQEEVARGVETGRFRKGQVVTEWTDQTYGTNCRVWATYSLLAHLRCALKVQRPLQPLADHE